MRRSLFVLATLAMSSALYAQADTALYTREKVLDIFAQYNPSVLERATQNAGYNAVLESFLTAYNAPETQAARYDLIAVARNFDNSIRLHALIKQYEESSVLAQLGGIAPSTVRSYAREQLKDVFQNIWAVTVQLRELQLKEAQDSLKQLRKDKTLSKEARSAQVFSLKQQIKALKAELKAFKKNPGEQILTAVDSVLVQADERLAAQVVQQAASSEQSLQTENLQIKTKNKKPVAK